MAEQPPEQTPPSLRLVAGKYELVREIGRGGMGSVWEARHASLDTRVAIKFIDAQHAKSEDARSRFDREAKAAARLRSKHAIQIFDHGVTEDGVPFIVMELLVGMSLDKRLEHVGRLPLQETARLLEQVCRALEQAHSLGIVHRDLKPENIFLVRLPDERDEIAKVLDFGVAKIRSEGDPLTSTVAGAILGTPFYMSPEQAEASRALDHRSDLWSLGVIAYRCVTGVLPFEATSLTQLLMKVCSAKVAPPSSVVADLPAAFDAWIARALDRDPARRFQTAFLAAQALGRAAGPGAITGDEPTEPRWDAGALSGDGLPPSADPSIPTLATDARPRSRGREGEATLATATLLRVPSGDPDPLSKAHSTTSGVASKKETGAARAAPRRSVLGAAYVSVALVACGLLARSIWSPRAFDATARQGVNPGASGSAGPAVEPGSLEPRLACPPLVASGVPEPSGWLGAAAANIACRRAALLLGGRTERTLSPAELLELPKQPTDVYPRDPYGATDARSRAMAAAKAKAPAYTDGQVTRTISGFRVTLLVRSRDDRELARGQADAKELYQAVREAMKPLVRPDVLPRAAAIDPAIAEWSGVSDVELALELDDWRASGQTSAAAAAEEREHLRPRRTELGWLWGDVEASDAAVPLDRTSAATFARTAPLHATRTPGDAASLAAELSVLRAKAQTDAARRSLTNAEASLWGRVGDNERERQVSLASVQDDPQDGQAWDLLRQGSYGLRGFGAVVRANAAWHPDEVDAWNGVSFGDDALTVPERLAFVRRTNALSSDNPLWTSNLGTWLLRAGDREEARALAGRAAAEGGEMAFAGEEILARVEASEARFGEALAHGKRLLAAQPQIGGSTSGFLLTQTLLQVALVADQSRGVADDFARTFLDPEPPRIVQNRYGAGTVAEACAHASAVVARQCFGRLRTLQAEHYFGGGLPAGFVEGCERFAAGDMKGATAAWRPLVEGGGAWIRWLMNIAPAAFDSVGERELAERVDARNIAQENGAYHGASLAHVRSARRAAALGNRERARALASQVIDAWSVADVPVPVVAEMRALLTRLH